MVSLWSLHSFRAFLKEFRTPHKYWLGSWPLPSQSLNQFWEVHWNETIFWSTYMNKEQRIISKTLYFKSLLCVQKISFESKSLIRVTYILQIRMGWILQISKKVFYNFYFLDKNWTFNIVWDYKSRFCFILKVHGH